MSRYSFWDRNGQLFGHFIYLSQITVPEVFAKVDVALCELLLVSQVFNEEMSRDSCQKFVKK